VCVHESEGPFVCALLAHACVQDVFAHACMHAGVQTGTIPAILDMRKYT
jgi:hypothetical protein